MVRSILLLLAFATPYVAAPPAPGAGGAGDDKKADTVPKDFVPLQGTWKVAKVTMSGKEVKDRGLSDATLTFKDSELVCEGGEPRERFSLESDPGATPKAFKATRVEPARQQSGWMIYSLERGELKLAFYDALKGRPEGFEPRPKLIVLELSRKAIAPE